MPCVTALEAQRRGERVNVHLDGEFAFGLAAITAQQNGLYVGRELSQEEIDFLLAEDVYQRAFNRALLLLSYRPRSESEIRQRLTKAKIEPEVIDRVIERLRVDRLVDDREFARYWAENRSAHSPRGARMLAMELRQKGVDRPVIDEALEESVDEEAGALAAGRKKLRQLAALEYRDFRQKMGAYLVRRGFGYDVVRDAVNHLWREARGEAPEDDDPVAE